MKNLICNTCGKVSTVAYDEQGCLSCGDPLAVPVDDYMLDIARGLAYKHYRVIAAQGLLFDGGIAESRLAFESRRPIKEMLNGIKMKQDNWGVKITKSYPLDLERKMLFLSVVSFCRELLSWVYSLPDNQLIRAVEKKKGLYCNYLDGYRVSPDEYPADEGFKMLTLR